MDIRADRVRHPLDFFRDIGATRDLDTSLRNTFGLTAVAVEQRWKDYLARSALEPPPT